MKNVTKFDKATLNSLRTEMQAVLNKFGANLEFEVGNMRFSDAEVDIKVKAKVKGAETVSSLLFAIVVATFVHTYFIQPYTIPSSSLEKLSSNCRLAVAIALLKVTVNSMFVPSGTIISPLSSSIASSIMSSLCAVKSTRSSRVESSSISAS